MNPRKRNANLTFTRQVDTVGANGRRTLATSTVNATPWPCLVEGLHAKGRSTLVGRVDQAAYVLSWSGSLSLRDGDLTTYNGKQYAVREILDDTTRPSRKYFTAYLQERNR